MLVVFIGGFFLAPTTKLLNNLYYIFILVPIVVFYLAGDGLAERSVQLVTAYRWFFIFVATLLFSSLINGIDLNGLATQLKRVLYVFGFLLAVKVALQQSAMLWRQLLPVTLAIISLASLYCLYQWFNGPTTNSLRMQGFGITENSVRLGAIYGFACVASTIAFLQGKTRASWAYLIPVILTLFVAFLSQSRGPLLATGISIGLALLIIRGSRSGLMAVALTLGAMALISEYQDSRIFTLEGRRIELWHVVIDKILLSTWLGYGLHAPDTVQIGSEHFEHPHGGYITTIFFGGLLALVALLILIATTVLEAIKQPATTPWLILLSFGLIYMAFDGSRLFYHPRELWLVFWLPMAFLLALITPKIEF